MKRISSKLILFILTLTTSVLLVTTMFSFNILKRESRAYTFQGQKLQTELFSESLRSSLSKVNDILGILISIDTESTGLQEELRTVFERTSKNFPEFKGIGIKREGNEQSWTEFPKEMISKSVSALPDFQDRIVTKIDGNDDEVLVISKLKNAKVAIRFDLSHSFQTCLGLNMAWFNTLNQAIHFCTPDQANTFQDIQPIFEEIDQLKLGSGTLERAIHGEPLLWAYAQVGGFGRTLSSITEKVAYAPAYSLAIRVLTLILMALGASLIATIFISRKITQPIETVTRATKKIADGEFDTKIELHTQDETKTLAEAVEAMAVKIKGLLESEVEKAKIESQLEVAGTLQKTFIPPSHVSLNHAEIWSYYRSADQCGGDWWGHVENEKYSVIMIGDVTGHGYGSALLVATTRGFISMLQNELNQSPDELISPAYALSLLNHVVYDATHGGLNMTAMCIVIENETGNFSLASAGHNAAFQIHSEQKLSSLRSEGSRLGESPALETELEVITGLLLPNEKIILYTDGIQDLGPGDSALGRKGFRNFLNKYVTESSEVLSRKVEEDLIPLHQGHPLLDDVTFVVVERSR